VRYTAFIPGWCKSAGTLTAIGAHDLVIGDFGELGPLDVQMPKTDELFELSSGLTVTQALSTLEQQSFRMFERYFLAIKQKSWNQITFRTATEVAAKMVVGLMEPIYRQIDPMHVGEAGRAMQIAADYAVRLDAASDNLHAGDALWNLVSGYAHHGFVIDRLEAAEYFQHVEEPTDEEAWLAEQLADMAKYPMSEDASGALIEYLSEQTPVGDTIGGGPLDAFDAYNGAAGATSPPATEDAREAGESGGTREDPAVAGSGAPAVDDGTPD
jgi:hypothetical protein